MAPPRFRSNNHPQNLRTLTGSMKSGPHPCPCWYFMVIPSHLHSSPIDHMWRGGSDVCRCKAHQSEARHSWPTRADSLRQRPFAPWSSSFEGKGRCVSVRSHQGLSGMSSAQSKLLAYRSLRSASCLTGLGASADTALACSCNSASEGHRSVTLGNPTQSQHSLLSAKGLRIALYNLCSQPVPNRVEVEAPPAFVRPFLLGLLEKTRQRHPKIKISMIFQTRYIALLNKLNAHQQASIGLQLFPRGFRCLAP